MTQAACAIATATWTVISMDSKVFGGRRGFIGRHIIVEANTCFDKLSYYIMPIIITAIRRSWKRLVSWAEGRYVVG